MHVGLPRWLEVKNLRVNLGNSGSISGSGRSPEKEMATHSVSLPRKPHGQRILNTVPGVSRVGHDLATKTTINACFVMLLRKRIANHIKSVY